MTHFFEGLDREYSELYEDNQYMLDLVFSQPITDEFKNSFQSQLRALLKDTKSILRARIIDSKRYTYSTESPEKIVRELVSNDSSLVEQFITSKKLQTKLPIIMTFSSHTVHFVVNHTFFSGFILIL